VSDDTNTTADGPDGGTATARGDVYFEDIDVGVVGEFGSRRVTRDAIVSFAESFDPQPKHTDEAAAEAGHFGGLIASGWHTAAVCMRLLVDNVFRDWRTVAARGVQLEWLEPVRPGDDLSVRFEVLDTRRSESTPSIGYVDSRLTGVNGEGVDVITWTATSLVEARAGDDAVTDGGGDE
jgi:acyl dehydratase